MIVLWAIASLAVMGFFMLSEERRRRHVRRRPAPDLRGVPSKIDADAPLMMKGEAGSAVPHPDEVPTAHELTTAPTAPPGRKKTDPRGVTPAG